MRMLLFPLLSLLIATLYQPSVPVTLTVQHPQSPSANWYAAALQHIGQQSANVNSSNIFNVPFVSQRADSVLPGPGRAEAEFGTSVASAGDLNGDGYSDVVIGAPMYDSIDDDFYRNEGRVYVYYGAATGLPVEPDLTLAYNSNVDGGERFGKSVSGGGDINGDGYADLIIGAYFASDDGYNAARGHVLVYFGSATGIHAEADTMLKESMGFSLFGESVAGAGDINGDGYSDIIVGAPGYRYGSYPDALKGRVSVYYGSATGFSAVDHVEGEQYQNEFGQLVAGIGDVNADGYSDIAVSAPNYHVYNPNADGAVFIYYGSATGLTLIPAHVYTNAQPIAATGFSRSIAGGGDLNGDGYSDLVLSQPNYYVDMFNDPTNIIARLLVYYGSASGLPASPVIIDSTGRPGIEAGGPIGHAGDVNGDGYADIIVAGSDTNAHASRLLLYRGGPGGLSDTVQVIDSSGTINLKVLAAAGDVDGDGYTDIVGGDPVYMAGDSANAGRAYIFHGAPDTTGDGPPRITFDSPGLTVIGFGKSLQQAGDINGDGYSDIVIGDPNFIKSMTNYEGQAYVYYGSANGTSSVPDVTLDVNTPDCRMGYAVAGAGDINGDGYADLLVSAPRYNTTAGRVFVYYGSAAGLNTAPSFITAGPNSRIGYAVAGAGDVNGDGYADVMVSAYNEITAIDTGKVLVYYGTAAGLPATPDIILQGVNDTEMAGFGRSMASAGDVNGDGYADVIIGAVHTSDGMSDWTGRGYVFMGSDTGLAAVPAAILDNTSQIDPIMGMSVAGVGDINGDGFTDALVSAPGYNNGTGSGQAFVYLGAASGIATTPSDTLGISSPSAVDFGKVVAPAGDVNSDGYADVIVTDDQYDGVGIVYLYRGSATGLEAIPDSIHSRDEMFGSTFGSTAGTAGDVNGDGYADLLLGNLYYSSFGRVYLFLGNKYGGQRNNLRLYNSDLTTLLNAANMPESYMGVGLLVHSTQGTQKGRLVWETRATGQAFSGTPVTNSTAYTGRQTTYTLLSPAGTELKNQVAKTGKATLLRARVEYDPTTTLTGQRFGPWRYPQTMGRSAAILLPLEIRTFTAVKQQSAVLLKWTVASHEPGAVYTLERSSNGHDFAPVYSTPALSDVTQYQWRDESPLPGKNYFRLAVIDGDHKKYSRMALVVFGDDRPWLVYPNPVRAGAPLTIQVPGASRTVSVQLANNDGRMIYQKVYAANNGFINIDTQRLPAGQYVISIIADNKRISKSVVVVR